MTYRNILPRFMMVLMAALTLAACSDKDEPGNVDTVTHHIDLRASFRGDRELIDYTPYIDIEDVAEYEFVITETGSYTIVDGKPVTRKMDTVDNWVRGNIVTFDYVYLDFSANYDENRYAIVNAVFTKNDGSKVIFNITLYQEGKRPIPVPEGVDYSYTLRVSVIADDGSDLLDPAHPYTIYGNLYGEGISIIGSFPEIFFDAETTLIDEVTGLRYIPVEHSFPPGSINLPDIHRFAWGLYANHAVVEVSEADAEGRRTYTIDGGEPRPLENDGLITLVTPPAESLHYKPLAIPIRVVDVHGHPTDRLYLTATGADSIEHTASTMPGNPVYSREPAPGGPIWPLYLADEEPELTYYGLFVPYEILTLGGTPIEYKKGSLYALGEYDSTKPFEETFTIKLKTKDGDRTHGTYTVRIVNYVKQIANYKKSSPTVTINGDMTDFGLNSYITLREQSAKE